MNNEKIGQRACASSPTSINSRAVYIRHHGARTTTSSLSPFTNRNLDVVWGQQRRFLGIDGQYRFSWAVPFCIQKAKGKMQKAPLKVRPHQTSIHASIVPLQTSIHASIVPLQTTSSHPLVNYLIQTQHSLENPTTRYFTPRTIIHFKTPP